MKKLAFVVLILLAAGIVTLPGAVGLIAEQGHETLVTRVDGLEAERWERGWFVSEARHRFAIEEPHWRDFANAMTGAPGGVDFVVASRLAHGPLPALAVGGSSLTPAWTSAVSVAALQPATGTPLALPGQLTSRVAADGRVHFEYRASADSSEFGEGIVARWQPAHVDATLSRGGDALVFDGSLAGVVIEERGAAVNIGRTRFEGQHSRVQSGLWTGRSDWEVESLRGPRFTIDDVGLATNVAERDGQPVYRMTVEIGKLVTGAYHGNALTADVEIANVPPETMAEILELAASGRPLDLFAAHNRPLLARVLESGPTITLHRLHVPTDGAAIDGEATMAVAPGTQPGGRYSEALSGTAELAVPRTLVDGLARAGTDQLRAAIELMIALRMLRPEQQRYRVTARYENGSLNVNGLPVPLPAF